MWQYEVLPLWRELRELCLHEWDLGPNGKHLRQPTRVGTVRRGEGAASGHDICWHLALKLLRLQSGEPWPFVFINYPV